MKPAEIREGGRDKGMSGHNTCNVSGHDVLVDEKKSNSETERTRRTTLKMQTDPINVHPMMCVQYKKLPEAA